MLDEELKDAMDNLVECYLETLIDPCEITLQDYENAVREMEFIMNNCHANLEELSRRSEFEDHDQ